MEDHEGTNPGLPQETPVFLIDVRGVKTRLTPSDPRTSVPISWRETARRVNDDLKRLTVELSGTLVDLANGIRRVIRGIAGIPSAIATRIEGPRATIEQGEQRTQKTPAEHLLLELYTQENNLILVHPGNAPEKKLPQSPDKTLPPGPETSLQDGKTP